MNRTAGTIGEEERRAHLAAIVDSSDDAILSKDLEGIITSWNPGATRLYGYTAEEAIGQPVSILMPDDRSDELHELMDRLRRGERVDHFETVRETKDGRLLNISLTVSPIRDDQGEITGFSAVGRDITDRIRADAALRASERQKRFRSLQFETLVNRAPFGVYFVDADFRVQQVNPVAEPIFAGFPGGAVGQDFAEVLEVLWGEDRAEELVRIFRHTLETGEPYHVSEFAEQRADVGLTEYYDWRTERLVLPDGRYGVVCYFRDVSEEVHARQAITRSEERYRTLFDSIDEGFFVGEITFDEAGEPVDYRFVETNPAFERHTGLVDAVGRTAREMVPGLESRWIEIYGRVATTGEPERFVDHSPAMGRWFEVDAFRVGDPEQYRVGALFNDITERKQSEDALRESEERLRLAKAAAGLGIHDFNPSTGSIGWDARTREIWGVGEDEPITYEIWLEGLHPDDRDPAEAAVRRALDPAGDGVYLAEYRVINRRDGVTRWIQVTGQATFVNGEAVRLVGTVQDITERKRTEEALKEADRRKDEFLATLSHELRNPLAAIHAALSVLDTGGGGPEPVDRMTAIIGRQSSQLVRLIDDLLDVTRISRGKVRLERERMDVAVVVREVVDDFVATCEERGIELSVDERDAPIAVDADPVRLAQVVNNLISNACKFTPAGGTVRVTAERDGREAVVRVADTGIGMTDEQLERVFEMFAQGDQPEGQRTKGLGIGLSLARSIMELHGGTIEATSEGPGKGSEFRVRLPTAKAIAEATEMPRQEGSTDESPGSGGRRILAAEDNADALYALAMMLRIKGHDVATATDGSEALEKVREHRPEIALLDIDMPGLDGYEVARRIRQEPWGRDMVLIAMTGWGQEKDKRAALEAGFDMHMTKPVDPAGLEDVLRAHGD